MAASWAGGQDCTSPSSMTYLDRRARRDRRAEMTQALEAEQPDVAVVQGYYAGAHDSIGQAHWAEMRAGLLAMGVLTDPQRAKVRETLPGGGMQHRHGQGGR